MDDLNDSSSCAFNASLADGWMDCGERKQEGEGERKKEGQGKRGRETRPVYQEKKRRGGEQKGLLWTGQPPLTIQTHTQNTHRWKGQPKTTCLSLVSLSV